jgi:hypothetical protein
MPTHTMEYYSAIKKKESSLFADKLIEVENIMLNEVLSHMWKIYPNTNASIIIYIYIYMIYIYMIYI